MISTKRMPDAEYNDTELVAESLSGRTDSFGRIVERYQSLICSLAYSATGSLSQSEDLAQETFVVAWRQLAELREPAKLRAWLCGIMRCLIGKAFRRDQREPSHAAESLETVDESAALTPLPDEQAIGKEEEAILWRTLKGIPETYREPLILFYRKHQSVEQVAQALDLSPDAVKQRLSRGRILLHEQVTAFVEGALKQSAPGHAFTLGVLAVLPAHMATVGAASAGVTLAKGGATTKAGAWLAAFNSLAGLFTGFVATYLNYKMSMEGAASDKERQVIKRFFGLLTVCIVVPVTFVFLAAGARPLAESHPTLFAGAMIGVATAWIPASALLVRWIRRRLLELNGAAPGVATETATSTVASALEYRTRACLFGLPLIHVRLGGNWARQHDVVKAWIAIGDTAIGVIFAFGGMAIAPICIGGFAVGGVVFGGFGAGVLCYAGFGIGVWVVGGLVSGLYAIGGCAVGWKAAAGGIAVAHQFAQGGIALAAHANDAAAGEFISGCAFFRNAFVLVTKWLWPTLLLSLLPSLLIWRATRKKRKQYG